jgi:shikimate dehydrogenase
MTDRYAVFGNPVAHSMSPQIHALFAQQTGQDMRYEAILAPPDGFENSVREFIAAGGRGANVTLPFKEQAFRLATQRTRRAEVAGAVNTLIFAGDIVTGDNTDGVGLVCDIEDNLRYRIEGRRVLLIGAGGAARGVISPLLDAAPASLMIANRTVRKAQLLAGQFSAALPVRRQVQDEPTPVHGEPVEPRTTSACSFEQLAGLSFDLIINATSAGLANAELSLPANLFAPGGLAYEMLYGHETPFMRHAKTANAQVVGGLGMLVEQAAEAFYVWRGVRPNTAPVLKALRGA